MSTLTPIEKLKDIVVTTLDEQKASNIVTYKATPMCTLADYFVICTGRSTRHVQNLAEKVVASAKKSSYPPLCVEGKEAALWVLVDLNGIIVHIMQDESRDFYQLEKLWQAPADKDDTESN
jgi:ribosome-associated protein